MNPKPITTTESQVAGIIPREVIAEFCRRHTHLVQNVGEAASRVSEPTRNAYAQIPWPQIIGTRHRLVHDYVRVDTNILWDIITVDSPTTN